MTAEFFCTENSYTRLILESIDDGVVVTDRSGRIVFLNSLAKQLTGWSGDSAPE